MKKRISKVFSLRSLILKLENKKIIEANFRILVETPAPETP